MLMSRKPKLRRFIFKDRQSQSRCKDVGEDILRFQISDDIVSHTISFDGDFIIGGNVIEFLTMRRLLLLLSQNLLLSPMINSLVMLHLSLVNNVSVVQEITVREAICSTFAILWSPYFFYWQSWSFKTVARDISHLLLLWCFKLILRFKIANFLLEVSPQCVVWEERWLMSSILPLIQNIHHPHMTQTLPPLTPPTAPLLVLVTTSLYQKLSP